MKSMMNHLSMREQPEVVDEVKKPSSLVRLEVPKWSISTQREDGYLQESGSIKQNSFNNPASLYQIPQPLNLSSLVVKSR